jgi:ABC-type Fe3+-hydroxamate transport system substrate-binding protein
VPIIARGSGNFAVRDGAADPTVDLMPWQVEAGGADVPFSQAAYGGQTNLEELARLAPDVLFLHHANFTTVDDEWYRKRSDLVPIVVVPAGIEGIRVVADVFDIDRSVVDELVAQAEAKLAGFVPPRVPDSITAFYYFDDGNFYVASAQHESNDLVLGPLGLPQFSMRGDDAFPPFRTISTERALELDADLVIALHDANFESALDTLEATALFKNIPAVREGRYKRATPEWTVAFNRPTVLSVDWLVDGFADLLAE